MAAPHPITRRWLAESLVRLRRADEQARYAASQRRGRIDPNPHQIDAVIFALRRIPEGGGILADEVGLGKTIEAGLVIAQLLAEGARRVLLVIPKPLLGQWQDELFTLFGIETTEGHTGEGGFAGAGVFLVGRELAGSERGAAAISSGEPFDLVVVDEAHEIFAGIWRRFDRKGRYDDDATDARIAHRVRGAIAGTPVLLLTATPIQNSLLELWGLVQYVEPTGTLLGDLPTFRDVFCDRSDRRLVPGQADELRRRVATVCRRTLRRQAQEFLEKPFVGRRALLLEYKMTSAERELYDETTAWLLEPDLLAFGGAQRELLLIGFHRRMASSVAALAASLRNVAKRLRRMLGDEQVDAATDAADDAADLEDDELAPAEAANDRAAAPAGAGSRAGPRAVDRDRVLAEAARVDDLLARAEALPSDGKAARLLDALRLVTDRASRGEGSGKLVIFTESLVTQAYLRDVLVESGLVTLDEVTLFRGTNDGERAAAALERWREEVGRTLPPHARPSRQVATRLALVHEFRTRSRVFIATEAGAKGLNLQFCETLVNYDLPWNPQRIEQRIGRCHRYGQGRDVTVINFIASDNEAERLTFEILSQKLDLFGTVLDASDAVLHEARTDAPEPLAAALGVELETRLRKVWERARTVEDVTDELRALRARVDDARESFEEAQAETASLIEARFDEAVRASFRGIRDTLGDGLAALDRDTDRLLRGFLEATGLAHQRSDEGGRVRYVIDPDDRLPDPVRAGTTVVIGAAGALEDAEPLHTGHPLVHAAVAEARAATAEPQTVRLSLDGDLPPALEARRAQRGRRGRLVVTKVSYRGFEREERLLPTALFEAGAEGEPALVLPEEEARALLDLAPASSAAPLAPPLRIAADELDDAVDEAAFVDQTRVARDEQVRFERALEQVERAVDDRALVERRRLAVLGAAIREAERKRDAAFGADARRRAERELRKLEAEAETSEATIERLDARDDEAYRRFRERAHERRYAAPSTERILDVEFELG